MPPAADPSAAALELFRVMEAERAAAKEEVAAAEVRAAKRQRLAEAAHQKELHVEHRVIWMLQEALLAAHSRLGAMHHVAVNVANEAVREGHEAAVGRFDVEEAFPLSPASNSWGLRLVNKRLRESSPDDEEDFDIYKDVAWETLEELRERSRDAVRSCFNMQHALNQ